jgi:hypothetical protein
MTVSEKDKTITINVSDSVITLDSPKLKITISIIEELAQRADEAFKSGHYLESAIINFQLVEFFLRLVIKIFAEKNQSAGSIVEKLKKEQRFFNLVIFLGLAKPDNGISERLFDFNATRNKVVHRIFNDFESIKSLKHELIAFHAESLELIEALRLLIPV